MLFYIYILAVLLGFILKKSRVTHCFILIFIWIISVFNTANPDYESYRNIYMGYYGFTHEIGFDLICSLFRGIGVSYSLFRGIVLTFSFILIYISIKQIFGRIWNHTLALFMMYPLLSMIITLRSTLSISIVLFAISCLFKSGNLFKRKIFFVIMILLATLIHFTSIAFLFILLCTEKTASKQDLFKILSIVVVATFLFKFTNLPLIIGKVFISLEKVAGWYTDESRMGLGIFIIYAFHITGFLIYYCLYNYMIKRINDTKDIKTAKLMYSLNINSFYIAGLYILNMQFFTRIYMVIYLLNLIYVSCLYTNQGHKRFVFCLFLAQTAYTSVLSVFIYSVDFQRVVITIFKNNLLLN